MLMRIECPKCGYAPGAADVWMCGPDGCGMLWNTFDTRARCPGCGAQFVSTACPACGVWSPHGSWYSHATQSGLAGA